MTYLAIQTYRTVREVAAAMRASAGCSLCRDEFATTEEQLCAACHEHVFGERE